ncbi:MAG TPA: hypothetical protein VFP19_01010, partial [Candidatus Limnocylindrales bacterium]|nr:hypothetical protein [Candidatus Limnocylindrales bacterium]
MALAARPGAGHEEAASHRAPRVPAGGQRIPAAAPRVSAGTPPSLDSSVAEALRRLAGDLSRTEGVGEILDEVLDNSVELFGADRVAVWFYDERRDHPLVLGARYQLPDEIADKVATLTA